MCGLIFAAAKRPVEKFVRVAHARQLHRGPDGQGMLFQEDQGVFLGMAHQRLAIVDLSDRGSQPMLSASGRSRILFNGEIYNHRELAEQFGLRNLSSGTDTEVIVELIERLGFDEAVRHFNGMWALIFQDIRRNRFFVSRDRFGKKPLYIHQDSAGIYLASEMHSLLGLPNVHLAVDAVSASRFLGQSLQNVDERTWLESIRSFPPASVAEIDGSDPASGLKNLRKFWKPDYESPVRLGRSEEYIEIVRAHVKDAIRLRLRADVPTGVALSGGLDSSIIAVESMRSFGVGVPSCKLFSAVNPGSKDDESQHIDVVGQHLNADVQRFILDPDGKDGLLDLLKVCTHHSDGPVSSFSSLLFYKLMESARSAGIKVVLTGQGADEVFCGYRKYPILEIKRLLQAGRIFEATRLAAGFIANGTILPQFNLAEAKRYSGFSNHSILGPAAIDAQGTFALGQITSLGERQWLDISRYSVPYLCHYEDRMSMACSREVRSPFLDYRVVEIGLQMPERLKLTLGWTKYALRRAFEQDLPRSILWRKDKKGFSNPQDEWLKGPLQPVVRDLMESCNALVYQSGLVDRLKYLQRFDAFCGDRGLVWFRDVFAPFSLELWLNEVANISREQKSEQCRISG